MFYDFSQESNSSYTTQTITQILDGYVCDEYKWVIQQNHWQLESPIWQLTEREI